MIEVKIDYIEPLQMFHMWIYRGGKLHFWYDFKPCDNMKLFLKLLKDGVLFKMKDPETINDLLKVFDKQEKEGEEA